MNFKERDTMQNNSSPLGIVFMLTIPASYLGICWHVTQSWKGFLLLYVPTVICSVLLVTISVMVGQAEAVQETRDYSIYGSFFHEFEVSDQAAALIREVQCAENPVEFKSKSYDLCEFFFMAGLRTSISMQERRGKTLPVKKTKDSIQ